MKYKDFVTSTGYGTGGGLCGWNCRHNFIPFNPETMKNNLPQYGLEENKEMYLNHQKQRYFERQIREWSQRLETTRKALSGNLDKKTCSKLEIQAKKEEAYLTKWKKKYKYFNKENNLRPQYDRVKIAKS